MELIQIVFFTPNGISKCSEELKTIASYIPVMSYSILSIKILDSMEVIILRNILLSYSIKICFIKQYMLMKI